MSHAFSVILQHFIFVFASSTITPFQEDRNQELAWYIRVHVYAF